VTVPAEAAAVAQQVLAKVGDTIGALLRSTTPAAPKRKVTSSPEAQALAAGLLRGLGEKYQDPELSKAGEFLQTQLMLVCGGST
jgi:hypothetical protein